MYEDFYGLNERPFSLTPDTEFLFLNQHYQDALDHLLYAVKRQEGFTVVLGDIGTGKTTLCWALLERLESNIQTALILNTSLNQEDILRAILKDLGVVRQTQPSSVPATEKKGGTDSLDPGWMERLTKRELLDEFNSYLKQNAEQKIFTVVVIDEAQNLTLDTLELLRMLSNLETAKRKLLQIIFVGQLEFEKRLKSLRQLNQRISTRFTLKPLSKEDTTEYIHHRLGVAGAVRRPVFEKGSLGKIYKYSNGYPRLINLICDRALLAGASQGADRITSKMVMQAVRNLRGGEDFSGRHLLQSLKKALPVVAPLILLLLGLLVLTHREIVPSNFFSRRPAPLSLPQNQPGTTETAGVVAKKTNPAIGARAPVENKKDASKPSQPTTQRPVTVTHSRYALQVHSFNTRERAETALAELERTGYPVFIQVEKNGPRKWFSVCVGPFAELEIARENAAILAMRERTSAIIRKFSVVEH